jgi:integrase
MLRIHFLSGTPLVARGLLAALCLTVGATTRLAAQEASLQDIAALLRHRSIETTAIYAKVDVGLLKQVAQPWPEV